MKNNNKIVETEPNNENNKKRNILTNNIIRLNNTKNSPDINNSKQLILNKKAKNISIDASLKRFPNDQMIVNTDSENGLNSNRNKSNDVNLMNKVKIANFINNKKATQKSAIESDQKSKESMEVKESKDIKDIKDIKDSYRTVFETESSRRVITISEDRNKNFIYNNKLIFDSSKKKLTIKKDYSTSKKDNIQNIQTETSINISHRIIKTPQKINIKSKIKYINSIY